MAPGNAVAEDEKPPVTSSNYPPGSLTSGAASIIGALGLGAYRDTFAGLVSDAKAETVAVYVTNSARGASLIADATRSMPAKVRAGVKIGLHKAPFARTQLEAARAELWKQSPQWLDAGAPVHSIAVRADGTGLVVGTSNAAAGQHLSARGIQVPGAGLAAVSVRSTPAPKKTSRSNDSAPYWGGTPVKGFWDWDYRCTSAFGMTANGREYLMTADHCFDLNDLVEEPNGDNIGNTRIRNFVFDSTGIEGSVGGAVYLNDTTTDVYDLAEWSWNGDLVCQSGYTSARASAVCGIFVIEDNIEYNAGDGVRRGVLGQRCGGCVAVRHGDSGGPIWALRWDGALESRGINSAGALPLNDDEDDDYEYIYWTETMQMLSTFGGQLITTSW